MQSRELSRLEARIDQLQAQITSLMALVEKAQGDTGYIRGYIQGLGSLDGTMAGMAARLESMQKSIVGRVGVEVREKNRREDPGLMEIGRMNLQDFLKMQTQVKNHGIETSGSEHGVHIGRIGGRPSSNIIDGSSGTVVDIHDQLSTKQQQSERGNNQFTGGNSRQRRR